MKVIIINGLPRSGKDTFIQKCMCYGAWRDRPIFITTISMVSKIKIIAKELGWNGEKTPKSRKFLADLKDTLDSYFDTSYKDVEKYIEYVKRHNCNDNYLEKVIFIVARSPYDIERLKQNFNAYTLLIYNPNTDIEDVSNHADADIFSYEYDEYISNDGNLEDLQVIAENFIERILKDGPDY